MELTQKQIEQIKETYPSGTKVECIRMDDPYHAIPSGMMGIVDYVDDTGTIHMQWANGSSLGLIPGEDLFRIIKSPIKKKGLER